MSEFLSLTRPPSSPSPEPPIIRRLSSRETVHRSGGGFLFRSCHSPEMRKSLHNSSKRSRGITYIIHTCLPVNSRETRRRGTAREREREKSPFSGALRPVKNRRNRRQPIRRQRNRPGCPVPPNKTFTHFILRGGAERGRRERRDETPDYSRSL